jgi:hypothetical protein
MSEFIQMTIKKDVFERLQKLATPLVDDTSSVITKLIDSWDKVKQQKNTQINQAGAAKYFICSRGERLPIGTKLRAIYRRREFGARVDASGIVFEGKGYNNPSLAGIEAKRSHGAVGNAANTNGWTFWEYFDDITGHWRSLDDFRKDEGHSRETSRN